jgi:5-methyltetrahydrofolate--homocysteine methyltransferase
MDMIMSGRTPELAVEIDERMGKRSKAEELINQTRIGKLAAAQGNAPAASVGIARSDVATDVPVPHAPFWGSRVVTEIDLDQIYPFINPIALFRGQWQVKKGATSDEEYDALLEDKIEPIFERLKQQCKAEKILRPSVVYGYFPCNSDGDDLIVWDHTAPKGEKRERLRFSFPRQTD